MLGSRLNCPFQVLPAHDDDHSARVVLVVVFRLNQPADRRLDSQGRKQIAGDERAKNRRRAATIPGYFEGYRSGAAEQIRKPMDLIAKALVGLSRYTGHMARLARIHAEELYQLLRIADGELRSTTASSRLNIAVFAPVPNARQRTITAVNPGLRRIIRRP